MVKPEAGNYVARADRLPVPTLGELAYALALVARAAWANVLYRFRKRSSVGRTPAF